MSGVDGRTMTAYVGQSLERLGSLERASERQGSARALQGVLNADPLDVSTSICGDADQAGVKKFGPMFDLFDAPFSLLGKGEGVILL